ncbi:hypothetical protein FN846DRAFT_891153 [Sphaerosporella brunnea]|uniref:Uncharacterized protein n=1 Tax=Sphaerosporella brunnea TaxID=1250544 RepID=A0A5J5EU69_9PEZI|nr:hypothetical protein FN846DRAFT_891153 [Sphaerosporella brunnea]
MQRPAGTQLVMRGPGGGGGWGISCCTEYTDIWVATGNTKNSDTSVNTGTMTVPLSKQLVGSGFENHPYARTEVVSSTLPRRHNPASAVGGLCACMYASNQLLNSMRRRLMQSALHPHRVPPRLPRIATRSPAFTQTLTVSRESSDQPPCREDWRNRTKLVYYVGAFNQSRRQHFGPDRVLASVESSSSHPEISVERTVMRTAYSRTIWFGCFTSGGASALAFEQQDMWVSGVALLQSRGFSETLLRDRHSIWDHLGVIIRLPQGTLKAWVRI